MVASGEDLHQIPDGSMDVVVSTLVLCSVGSIQKVLGEVLRVLRQVSKEKKGDLCPTRGPPVLAHVWDKWNRLHEGQDELESTPHFFQPPGRWAWPLLPPQQAVSVKYTCSDNAATPTD